jgi:hypothetical protein
MKRVLGAMSVMTLAVLLLCALFSQAAADSVASIKLLNPPPNQLLELAVGKSYTFDILVESDEPFILAMAMPDAYYPGRGVSWRRGKVAHHDTEAVVSLTMTAKKSTDGLLAVCDWPEPGICWPEGVAPVSIVAGVRYKKGVVISEQFPFAVVVP